MNSLVKTISKRHMEAKNFHTTPRDGKEIGVKAIDKCIRPDNGLFIITAYQGNGKSTFAKYYTYRDAIVNDRRTLYIPYEQGVAGDFECQLIDLFGSEEAANEYVLLLDEPHKATNVDYILNATSEIIKDGYKIDNIVIDAYTAILTNKNDTSTYAIGQDLYKLQQYAYKHNMLVILCVHQKDKTFQWTQNGETGEMEVNRCPVTLANCMGSSNFGYYADFALGISKSSKYENMTCFTVLKVRDDNHKGKSGRKFHLKIDTEHGIYYQDNQAIRADETGVNDSDIPFDDFIRRNFQDTPDTAKGKLNEIMAAEINFRNECLQRNKQKEQVPCDILEQTKVSLFNLNAPAGKQKIKDITLKQAVTLGEDYKEQITVLRQIDRATDEAGYKAIKKRLPAFTPSCLCGDSPKDIKVYNPIICVDINGKDNQQGINEIWHKVVKWPYTLYSSISAGGKGVFVLIMTDTTQATHKQAFTVLQADFKETGITIDKACSNVNRLRMVSWDENAYFNAQARIYRKKKKENTQPYAHTEEEKTTQTELEIHSTVPKEKLLKFIEDFKEVSQNHLQITTCHDDTLNLAKCFASVFDEKGRELLHMARKQRKGYEAWKTDNAFNDAMEYVKSGHPYTLSTFYKYYNQAKRLAKK